MHSARTKNQSIISREEGGEEGVEGGGGVHLFSIVVSGITFFLQGKLSCYEICLSGLHFIFPLSLVFYGVLTSRKGIVSIDVSFEILHVQGEFEEQTAIHKFSFGAATQG